MSLQFALIGCGRIGERHAENMNRAGKIIAVCDIIKEKANALAEKYKAKACYNVDELLKEKGISVVAVCTPNGYHSSHSIKALEAGKNVLCEKPLCINSKDGKDMIDAAEKADKKLFVVKQNRYNPPVKKLKEILLENRLGAIYSFQLNCFWNRPEEYYKDSWRGTRELDGGTLFTQFSHFIDLLYWLLGDVDKVSAIGKNYSHPSIQFEDTGVAILQMQSGIVGTLNYTVNSYQKNMEGSITIFGEKGTIKIGGQYLNELEYQSLENFEITDLLKGNDANNYGFYSGSMSNHDKVYEDLVKALNHNEHELSNAAEGLKTVEIIEKIYKSMQS